MTLTIDEIFPVDETGFRLVSSEGMKILIERISRIEDKVDDLGEQIDQSCFEDEDEIVSEEEQNERIEEALSVVKFLATQLGFDYFWGEFEKQLRAEILKCKLRQTCDEVNRIAASYQDHEGQTELLREQLANAQQLANARAVEQRGQRSRDRTTSPDCVSDCATNKTIQVCSACKLHALAQKEKLRSEIPNLTCYTCKVEYQPGFTSGDPHYCPDCRAKSLVEKEEMKKASANAQKKTDQTFLVPFTRQEIWQIIPYINEPKAKEVLKLKAATLEDQVSHDDLDYLLKAIVYHPIPRINIAEQLGYMCAEDMPNDIGDPKYLDEDSCADCEGIETE